MEISPALSWVKAQKADLYAGDASELTSFRHKYWSLLLCGDAHIAPRPPAARAAGLACYNGRIKTDVLLARAFPFLVLPPSPYENVSAVWSGARRALHDAGGSHICQKPRNATATVVVLQRLLKRRVLNLEAMLSNLRSSWPEIVFVTLSDAALGGLVLSETGEAFCDIRGIIGGHGAGLANMLWMRAVATTTANSIAPPPMFVAQIIRPGQGGNVYGRMAKLLGFEYVQLSAQRSNQSSKPNHNDDVEADLESTATILSPLLSRAAKRGTTRIE